MPEMPTQPPIPPNPVNLGNPGNIPQQSRRRMLPPQPVYKIIGGMGGLGQAITIVILLFLVAGVFFTGLVFGMISTLAAEEEAVQVSTYREGNASNQIVIIPVESIISGYSAVAARNAVDWTLQNINKVSAVVLRVDSPGGGVTASDQIWYEVERLKNAGIPVISSYGGVAASGGYYVSCGTTHIMAEPTNITGSIGVIAQILTMEGLLEKVGIEPVTLIASGSPQKDVANDIFRSWNDKDREKVIEMLDSSYEVFLSRVKAGRSQTIGDESKIRTLADGSVFSATQALQNGLIDSIGYLDDAIALAETTAGLTPGVVRVVRLDVPLTFFDTFGVTTRLSQRNNFGNLDADRIRSLINDLASPRVMFLMR